MARTGAPAAETSAGRFRARGRSLLAFLLDRRRLAIIALLAIWVIVIAWGSGAAPTDRSWLGVPALGDILVVIVLAGALVGLALFVALLLSGQRTDTDLPPRKPMWPSLIIMLLVFAAIVWLPRREPSEETRPTPEPEVTIDEPITVPSGVVGRNEIVVLVVLVALSMLAMVWTRRRMGLLHDSEIESAGLDDALQPILAETVASLELGSDPRSAVLTAYAALESSFADLGWHRAATETPSEFVGRVLARFTAAAGPVTELAGLYELARFSERAISSDDRRRATRSLEAAQVRLAADTSGRGGAGGGREVGTT